MLSLTHKLLFVVVPALQLALVISSSNDGPCEITKRPKISEKKETARWMMHSIEWGVVSTISTRDNLEGVPFGNVYSFVDGTCDNSTGVPYLYTTELDQTALDATENPRVSLTISEKSIEEKGTFLEHACETSADGWGDPEMPPCARLVVTGEFQRVDDEVEMEFATNALFQRHPSMRYWPTGHEFFVAKIVIQNLWLIDIFGGASIIDVEEYFQTELEPTEKTKKKDVSLMSSSLRIGGNFAKDNILW
eukprot:CAMPEP_0195520928 /NCGR_PEP_ID=MMETSP0794_2-20130614/17625_1 /TAXON_ID=515487 /ORGANISM="Stephanopyxis turris, Strain CCMP 815" /LENGTH=248 /DNA_ID=CAMNT_0040650371 /DNA_START=75 /DNA_END=818 /DNA_ORIENTATION=+